MPYVPYILCTILFLIGLYAAVAKKNLIKIIIGLFTIEYATNLMLVLVGYRGDRSGSALAPVLGDGDVGATGEMLSQLHLRFVDPLPQALVLTSIVIGLGIMALVVAMAIRLYEKYNTFDISQIKRLRG
jgi:multicomponent Na+:H+ antiporter subunit C